MADNELKDRVLGTPPALGTVLRDEYKITIDRVTTVISMSRDWRNVEDIGRSAYVYAPGESVSRNEVYVHVIDAKDFDLKRVILAVLDAKE